MNSDYSSYLLKMQEHLLFNALPSDLEKHAAARKKISDDLANTVAKLVVHLRPSVVLEIGAHEATFACAMKAALPKSRVVAFEANPEIHGKVEARARAAGVEYLHRCIADENKAYELSVPGEDRPYLAMGSLLEYKKQGSFITYTVEGVTLDSFLGDVSATNVMWIDVEGAIGMVLAAARNSLAQCQLLFAELEASERWEGQMLDMEVIRRLAEFDLFPVMRDIQRHKWQHNVLFVRGSALRDPEVQKACFSFISESRTQHRV